MARQLINGTAAILAIVGTAMLAGCSNAPSPQPTAAISPAVSTDAASTVSTDQAVASAAQGSAASPTDVAAIKAKTQAAAAGFTVPVDKLDCEQMNAELDVFKTDGLDKKLAEFGKAKYQPTPEESARFTRLVAVKAATIERCKPVKKAKSKAEPKKIAPAETAAKAKAPAEVPKVGLIQKPADAAAKATTAE